MTVCLVLQGDSASPGARERMCSGSPYWRRSTPSTPAGVEGLGGRAGRRAGVPGRSALVGPEGLQGGLARPETEVLRLGRWAAVASARAPFPALTSRSGRGASPPERGCASSSLFPQTQAREASPSTWFSPGDRRPLCRWLGRSEASKASDLSLVVLRP